MTELKVNVKVKVKYQCYAYLAYFTNNKKIISKDLFASIDSVGFSAYDL